ncbi:UDP-2,4-diacetamido-2,4,6-trideoxy-beta-L-altropyranose hydrolase [Pontibacter harenae]|uniref:UDP-2,4-diacetamido-2,4, 6-trideoxy-beta-L-altropyranose hydrolase n=1 Tax=Pontibacter harenae TaxID=2894083 RepID=UPI001E494416|nr:UDP-2,4-diacetamido-2,4,6-trideoxy-beta-L-altropyranose hydrolase [Pontibacter harenae]MCC9167267.1 UDP-2,4-diacetamido-2,4,6-trideoxy-beta-L-altropyranose hydrolase [Pontibacter harenae]
MQKKSRIVFRADGSSTIGLGHVVRSLALASMLRDEFELAFAIQEPDEKLLAQIKQECEHVISLPKAEVKSNEAKYLVDTILKPDDVVILDGYHFDTTYQQQIKVSGCSLACIDDIHAYPFVADAIINQAGNMDSSNYSVSPYTKLYLGPSYALLRQPFLAAALQGRTYQNKVHVLLNMGGADPENYTLRIAEDLLKVKADRVEIVVGSAYMHLEKLQHWLRNKPAYKLHQNLGADAMCNLMQQCSLAVTSASGVSYEYCAVGGLLFVLRTAANQEGLYTFLTQNNLAYDYAKLPEFVQGGVTSEAFAAQVQKQRQFFDGKSWQLYQQFFQSLSLQASLILRHATSEDTLLLFDWANDPAVRARSFNTDKIKLEDHKRWLETKLAVPDSYLYIAEVKGEPAAHIRFDLKEERATLSYLISESFRGKGLGHTVLLKGIKQLSREASEVKVVEGLVQKDNIASIRAFEKAGFSYGEPHAQHPNAFRFVLQVNY